MKRLLMLAFILMITLFSYPLLSFADYIIHLKSGRQFVTQRYWEEGGEIKFNFKIGVLGVPRSAVVSIEEFTAKAPAPDETPNETEVKTKEEGDEKPDKKIDKKRPLEEYYEKMKVLKTKLDESLKKLREATRNKDKAAKKMAREDMRKFSKEIYKLTDEVKQVNNGVLPEDWWKDR